MIQVDITKTSTLPTSEYAGHLVKLRSYLRLREGSDIQLEIWRLTQYGYPKCYQQCHFCFEMENIYVHALYWLLMELFASMFLKYL